MTTNPIVDVEMLKRKECLSNADYILLLVEVCTNARRYKIHFSHTSKNFWDEVMSKQVLGKEFGIFKAETLRKYWRIIREVTSKQGFLHFIKQNEDAINNPSMKLLPVINAITSFLKENEAANSKTNFKEFLLKKTNTNTTNANVNEDDLLKRKRSKDKEIQIEEDVKEKDDVKKDPMEWLNQLEDRKDDMEEIAGVFMQNFPKKKKDDIISVLYKTSGNLQHAYLYLVDPDKYDKYAFVNTDDYIIQNLKGKPYYDQLVSSKGIDLVKEREKFLQSQSN